MSTANSGVDRETGGTAVTLPPSECSHSPTLCSSLQSFVNYLTHCLNLGVLQVNDDTVLETAGWTEKLVEQLLRFHPPNVGVAGPWFRDGNIAIMTHDFVHRTHVDIFGFYYPRVFTDWFADGSFCF